jgi:glycosyltransferase involved in cell wall biosynthesis
MISVVVPTRNRALQLERCLLSMQDLDHNPQFAWELIVVDNASQDGTKAVLKKFTPCLPLRYVFEPSQGVSRARNRGIGEARYPILAFTDDDCLVSPNWLAAIAAEFEKQPDVSVLSGKVELKDPGDYPVAIRMHDRAAKVTTLDQILTMTIGCNMAFRRAVFDHIGLFDPVFGKGTRIGSAEDLDLCYRALKAGSRIMYSPDMVVRHAHGRNTPESLASVTGDYVRGRGAFYLKFIRDREVLKMAYWEVRRSQSLNFLRALGMGAVYRLLGAW